jgi:hypothetical protein
VSGNRVDSIHAGIFVEGKGKNDGCIFYEFYIGNKDDVIPAKILT